MLYLVVVIGGERVAIAAPAVETVIELGPVTPVPRVPRHIAGLSALRSRVVTVVDSRAAIGLAPASPREIVHAIVVVIDGHGYALIADEVEDVLTGDSEPLPLAAGIAPGWARIASGMVELDGRLLLLVDPAALIRDPEALAA